MTLTRPPFRLAPLLIVLAAVGCRQCGERQPLLGRLRDRNPDDTSDRRGVDRFRESNPDGCDDTLPPPRRTGGYGNDPRGYSVSNGTGRFVSPLSGIPYSSPLPAGGYPALPSYPYSNPITIGQPENELPPGQLIPPANVPVPFPNPPTAGNYSRHSAVGS